MKLYARLENEKGKVDGMGGNEYLDIDITVRNEILARFTIRENETGGFSVYDRNDNELETQEGTYTHCKLCGEDFREIDGHNCRTI